MNKLATWILVTLGFTVGLVAGGAALAGSPIGGERPASDAPTAPETPDVPSPAPDPAPSPEPTASPEPSPPPVAPPEEPVSPGPPPEPAPTDDPVSPRPPPAPAPTDEPAPSGPSVPALGPGDVGEDVRRLQLRLSELGYWVGAETDGRFGELTEQAVLAFQKVERLHRDGLVGPATLAALETAQRPTPRSTDGSSLVEIDLERQVLFVVGDGVVTHVLNTSTGSGGEWVTPTGRFEVFREVDGVDGGPLGELYRPKYFNRGIAVHGSPDIPAHPASHGCARVHDAAMDMLWDVGALDIHTSVWVY